MSQMRILFAALALSLSVAGCDSQPGPCADDACIPKTGGKQDQPRDTPPPVPCTPACTNLLGDCDAEPELVRSEINACVDDCQAGTFTEPEVDCLAGLVCGEPVDGCFD